MTTSVVSVTSNEGVTNVPESFAVPILSSDSLPAKQVQQLTELLFSSREALEEQLGLALDPETDAVEGVGIPFHAGAAAWYKQAGITVD